jgi:glycosyltransferase involved in cell wall biosynthesis
MVGETMSQPLVSVVVRTCNHERYVEAALESVYEQDHDAVELTVIDDGSDDRTSDLVSGYASQERVRSRFRRVEIVEQETTIGSPAAFNRGVNESRGSYVNVLPGDERLTPGRLSTLLGTCIDRRAALAFARVEPCPDGPSLSAATRQHLYGVQDSVPFYPTVGYALLSSACVLSGGNLFFTRELFDRLGGFWDLPLCYDWDFALRSVLLAEPVFVPQPLYQCRVSHWDVRDDERTKRLEDETSRMLKNYLLLCRTRPVDNSVAPSPAWGPFFDGFIRASRYTKYLAIP